MKKRLQKIIADAGLASRREAERWIEDGQVKVNGQVVMQLGSLADPAVDKIAVKGKPLPKSQEKTFLILNKPPSCLTTMKDESRGRRTVMDFVKQVPGRVFPVGRLDYNTQGILLFTNDGGLAKKLLEPKYQLERTYQVKVRGVPDEKKLNRIRKGIRLDNIPTAPVKVKVLRVSGKNCVLVMNLTEGKNRHIKRICEVVGHPVVKLKRTHFGKLNLTGLPLGSFRFLSPREIKGLYSVVSQSA
ncbi:MAG: pseudouridine synthase [Nitrospinaceae bacterium]|nr:MAG: pseudouridine synthase [Nitrospinaceae bacterium]